MKNNFTIYTDGACSGNPGPGGYAFILIANNNIVETKQGFSKLTTNNRMELLAPIKALMLIKNTKSFHNSLSIYTDSNYLKEGITNWITKWKINGWKRGSGNNVKNIDLWMLLDELCNGLDVSWQWIKGHSDDSFNKLVDRLAREAIKKGLNGEIEDDPLGNMIKGTIKQHSFF